MQKFAFVIIFGILPFFWIFSPVTYGLEIQCPAEKSRKLTREEISTKIISCLDARNSQKESSLTDFYCPSGNFTNDDSRPLTEETLAYHISVALLFNEIDKDVLSYMCDLRELREKDPVKWTEDIRKKFEPSSEEGVISFAERYQEVCQFSYIPNLINSPEKTWIRTTETYPQSICTDIANRKSLAWNNMAHILMAEGISKSWQNDKDVFVEKIKGRYVIVYDKYLRYKRIAERAIKNLTALAKETIQR